MKNFIFEQWESFMLILNSVLRIGIDRVRKLAIADSSRSKYSTRVLFLLIFIKTRCVTRGGEEGEASPALVQNLNKSALILGINALTTFIYGFNFSFKMLF